jgi:lipopolysaccharide biosynthesis glycosyltransferase
MKKIALTILFDENYVEPALVTLCDLIRFAPVNFNFILVFMESQNDQVNSDVSNLLNNVLNNIDSVNKVEAIKFKGVIFDKFEKYHFTNSILYKLILPELLNYDFIVNIDAGFLSGKKIQNFFDYLLTIIEEPLFLNSLIGAICYPSSKDLSNALRVFKHNTMYPMGGILFFNSESYKKSKFFDRLISGYSNYKDQLVWAEQDLLCMVAAEGELYNLNIQDTLFLENLSVQGYLDSESSRVYDASFMLYKVTGTIKPWKTWVFDPKKKYYLDRREDVMRNFNFSDSLTISNNRFQVTHELIYKAFLAECEKRLFNI